MIRSVWTVWVDRIRLWWLGGVCRRKPCHTHSLAWDRYLLCSSTWACRCPVREGSCVELFHHDQQMNTRKLSEPLQLRQPAHGVALLLYAIPARSPGRDQRHSQLTSVCLAHHEESLVWVHPTCTTCSQLGLHSGRILGMVDTGKTEWRPSLILKRLDPSSRIQMTEYKHVFWSSQQLFLCTALVLV